MFKFYELWHWYLERNYIDSIDCFGWYGYFNVNFSNTQTCYMLPIICICFHFFPQCPKIFQYRSFTSLVKFIPRYFIFFVAIVMIVFLVSLCDNSLPVYKSVIHVWIFTLYSATLPNPFIRLNNFVCVCRLLHFLCTMSHCLQIMTALLSPLQFMCFLFLLLSDPCG